MIPKLKNLRNYVVRNFDQSVQSFYRNTCVLLLLCSVKGYLSLNCSRDFGSSNA